MCTMYVRGAYLDSIPLICDYRVKKWKETGRLLPISNAYVGILYLVYPLGVLQSRLLVVRVLAELVHDGAAFSDINLD